MESLKPKPFEYMIVIVLAIYGAIEIGNTIAKDSLGLKASLTAWLFLVQGISYLTITRAMLPIIDGFKISLKEGIASGFTIAIMVGIAGLASWFLVPLEVLANSPEFISWLATPIPSSYSTVFQTVLVGEIVVVYAIGISQHLAEIGRGYGTG